MLDVEVVADQPLPGDQALPANRPLLADPTLPADPTLSADQPPPAERPLRRDAERNRQRILDAATELFAERGLGVTLNDIAHHAGVGVGTVYRRFPDKEQLVEGLFEQKLERLVALMERAVADPDPWHGLTGFLEGALELQARDLALKDLIHEAPGGLEQVCRIRSRLFPLGEQLLRRAQEAGQMRADVEPSDLPMVQLMLASLIDGTRDVEPDLWRRFLPIVLRGMRADAAPPEPLPQPPLDPRKVDAVMSAAKLRRR
jgi:AcrR family transcriptional regulator